MYTHGKTKLIHNERVKLRSQFYSNMATVVGVGGVLLPSIPIIREHHWWSWYVILAAVLIVLPMHWWARWLLKDLEE